MNVTFTFIMFHLALSSLLYSIQEVQISYWMLLVRYSYQENHAPHALNMGKQTDWRLVRCPDSGVEGKHGVWDSIKAVVFTKVDSSYSYPGL